MTRLTAGFICAPEIGASIAIRTNRIAPVAIVLPSRATVSLPRARCSAMIPDPITVATRKNEPIPSAASRRARLGSAKRRPAAFAGRRNRGDGGDRIECRAVTVDGRFAGRVERFPDHAVGVGHPALLGLRIAAGGGALLEHRPAG